MTLLLVGIVAVILVILVAAFLTFRRGQDDDEEEPGGGRWSVRDRVRSAGRDGHWRSPAQEMRGPRRPERMEPPRPEDRLRRYDEPAPVYPERRPGRSRGAEADDRDYPGRPAGRYADAPAGPDYPASRARGARATGPAPRRPAARPGGHDTGGF
jgi:hypothetical protein